MSRINNITELRRELGRLDLVRQEQEVIIQNDFKELKESLKPLRITGRILSNMVSKHGKDSDLLAKGIGTAAKLLTMKLLLKKAPKFARIIAGFVVENLSVNLVAEKTIPFAEKIKNFIRERFQKMETPEKAA